MSDKYSIEYRKTVGIADTTKGRRQMCDKDSIEYRKNSR